VTAHSVGLPGATELGSLVPLAVVAFYFGVFTYMHWFVLTKSVGLMMIINCMAAGDPDALPNIRCTYFSARSTSLQDRRGNWSVLSC
jgi:hypothetical protein